MKVLQTDQHNISQVPNVRRRVFAAFDAVIVKQMDCDLEIFKEVVLNELVTNAIRYGKGLIEVTIDVCEDAIRIGVSDEGEGFDPSIIKCENAFDGLGEHGRGFALINAIADTVRFIKTNGKFSVIAEKRTAT
ncbi:MAG: ATP-binding protein [Actinobacteria bacterium]|nr:ATP-binding protein [Actinomycetota bacterium]